MRISCHARAAHDPSFCVGRCLARHRGTCSPQSHPPCPPPQGLQRNGRGVGLAPQRRSVRPGAVPGLPDVLVPVVIPVAAAVVVVILASRTRERRWGGMFAVPEGRDPCRMRVEPRLKGSRHKLQQACAHTDQVVVLRSCRRRAYAALHVRADLVLGQLSRPRHRTRGTGACRSAHAHARGGGVLQVLCTMLRCQDRSDTAMAVSCRADLHA